MKRILLSLALFWATYTNADTFSYGFGQEPIPESHWQQAVRRLNQAANGVDISNSENLLLESYLESIDSRSAHTTNQTQTQKAL